MKPLRIVPYILLVTFHLVDNHKSTRISDSNIWANVRSATNLSCSTNGIPIHSCIWEQHYNEHNNSRIFVVPVNQSNENIGQGIRKGYKYNIHGFDEGTCILEIQHVWQADYSSWWCKLDTNSGNPYSGSVILRMIRESDKPKLSRDWDGLHDGNIRDGRPENFSCTCAAGDPPPTFKWFIGDTSLKEGLTPINTTYFYGNSYPSQNIMNHRFTWRDSGKKLRCVVQQETMNVIDIKESLLEIDVKSAPQLVEENFGNEVSVEAVIGEEVTLSVRFFANPKPTKHYWFIDSGKVWYGKFDKQYKSQYLVHIENGIYQGNIVLASVREEDFNREFILQVSNDIGVTEFKVTLERKVVSTVTSSLIKGLYRIICKPVNYFGFPPFSFLCK